MRAGAWAREILRARPGLWVARYTWRQSATLSGLPLELRGVR
jgi:hypothetical protein